VAQLTEAADKKMAQNRHRAAAAPNPLFGYFDL
jgi:hypothetical protein